MALTIARGGVVRYAALGDVAIVLWSGEPTIAANRWLVDGLLSTFLAQQPSCIVLVFIDVSFAKDPRPPCRPADVREGFARVETAASARPRAFSRAPLPDMYASPTGLPDMFARAARAPSVRSSFAYPCSSAPRMGARYT